MRYVSVSVAKLSAVARILLAALILFVTSAPASALDPSKAITQYLQDIWQTKDGLPQNTITAIAQTPDG